MIEECLELGARQKMMSWFLTVCDRTISSTQLDIELKKLLFYGITVLSKLLCVKILLTVKLNVGRY